MKTFLMFAVFMLIATLVIVLAIILGDSGAWYLAWLLGTGLIVLVTAAGAVLLDTQDQDERGARPTRERSGDARD